MLSDEEHPLKIQQRKRKFFFFQSFNLFSRIKPALHVRIMINKQNTETYAVNFPNGLGFGGYSSQWSANIDKVQLNLYGFNHLYSVNSNEHCHNQYMHEISRVMKKKPILAYAKTKAQISFAYCEADQRLYFATWIVQFLLYLYSIFQASSLLLCLYSSVCVRPVWKPRRPVFLRSGSNRAKLDNRSGIV